MKPKTIWTLEVPAFPVPSSRISIPFNFPKKYPGLIVPKKYPIKIPKKPKITSKGSMEFHLN
ncbi:MAG: hypothetical protein ACFFCE_20055 [Promethearchaeota archaeon]